MKLSPAELSYLKDSLKASPPVRPDARKVAQFRPLQATTNFLPTANGSARIRTSDGSECIVGVKAKVVKTEQESDLINVDVDISGFKDNHPLPNVLASIFEKTLNQATPQLRKALKLTSRFSFKLFIDGLVLSHSSHPLGLLSLTIYLALLSTKLPLITSSTDDSKAEEIPVFHDDWNQAIPLCGQLDDGWKPPLLFLLGIVGSNVIVDPSEEEEQVAEAGVIVGWSNGSVSAPLQMIDLDGSRTSGLRSSVISNAYKLVAEAGPEVADALDTIISMETADGQDEFTSSLF